MRLTGNLAIKQELLTQKSWSNKSFWWILRALALCLVLLFAALFVVLWIDALPAFHKFGWRFFTSGAWDPVLQQFGAFNALVGTLITSMIAIVLSVPISLALAYFITQLLPSMLRRFFFTAIELMAAIPSIIYGMWGLFFLAPLLSTYFEPWLNRSLGSVPWIGSWFSGPPIGIGILPAGIVLAIMVIPIITAVIAAAFIRVPKELKESAAALGSSDWEIFSTVLLPYTKTVCLGAVILGFGRALGETMAVTFIIGNAHGAVTSLMQPGTTISATIANEFSEASTPMYTSSLMALGFVLLVVTFIVLWVAKHIIKEKRND